MRDEPTGDDPTGNDERSAALEVRQVGDELVVLEPGSDRVHVLDGPTATEFLELDAAGTARRDMLRKLGVTAAVGAVAVPGIQSIVMPSVAAAQSGDGGGGEGPDPDPGGGSGGTLGGVVTTFAGADEPGYVDGSLADARFSNPSGIAIGADGTIYVVDTGSFSIRKISTSGQVSTLAGTGIQGYADGQGTEAAFFAPWAITMGPDGNLYVSELLTQTVRRVTPTGTVTTVPNLGGLPRTLLLAPSGLMYVLSTLVGQVFRHDPTTATTESIAGSGMRGYVDGTGIDATFNEPEDMTISPTGDLIVADTQNNRLRRVTPAGVVTTFAGNGDEAPPGFDGPANVARFDRPKGLEYAPNGMLYVADAGSNRVRVVRPDGSVATVAGGSVGGADGTGAAAQFEMLQALAVGSNGSVYVVEWGRNRIRRIT